MKQSIQWFLILSGILMFFHLLLTGSPLPLVIRNSLHSPKQVVAVEDNAIKTVDELKVPLASAKLLRERPVFMEDILKYGVETAADGQVYGLFHINHWCGNDAVRFHLARVNLQSLVTYLEYAPPTRIPDKRIDPGVLSTLNLPSEKIREMYSEFGKAGSPDGSPASSSPQ